MKKKAILNFIRIKTPEFTLRFGLVVDTDRCWPENGAHIDAAFEPMNREATKKLIREIIWKAKKQNLGQSMIDAIESIENEHENMIEDWLVGIINK